MNTGRMNVFGAFCSLHFAEVLRLLQRIRGFARGGFSREDEKCELLAEVTFDDFVVTVPAPAMDIELPVR